MTHEVFYLSRDRILMTLEVLDLSCDQILMTRDRILMTQEPFYLSRDQILIIRCVLYVMHEVANLSDYAPALSGHKVAPSGFAYFCPRNRKGMSADINRPKSVVRKLRNEVIDRCSDVRPGLFGGFAPDSLLPFLPLIEEKEAKEDQGDDRHPSFQTEERRSLIHDLE